MSAGEYGARPFIAGSLTGVRAYRVAEDGTLTGIHYRQVVNADENLAECGGRQRVRVTVNGLDISQHLARAHRPEHQVAGLDCQCGFYAFFDGSDDYMRTAFSDAPDQPRVEAIVECYGTCVVGSRGFRAEKLRLVALIRNDPPSTPAEGRRDRAGRWLAEHPRRYWGGQLGLLAVALAALTGVTFVDFRWVAVEWAALSCSLIAGRLYRRGWRLKMEEHLRRLFGRSPAPTPADWTKIRAAYPDVPVYGSRLVALAMHPLTVPDAP